MKSMFGRFIRPVATAVVLLSAIASQSRARAGSNPGVIEIDNLKAFTQVLAMSDAHGEYDHLTRLLNAAGVTDGSNDWAAGKTLFIVTGDSIDKGPDSTKILALWIKLMPQAATKGGQLVVLLGNHEAEFLADPQNKKSAIFRAELSKAGIPVQDVADGKDSAGLGELMLGMPLAARAGKFLFCHAGWFPADTSWEDFVHKAKATLGARKYGDDFITGPHSILEEKDEKEGVKWYDDKAAVRSLEDRLAALNLYGVVFGHQPEAFGFKGTLGGVDHLHIIKIDSGMAPDAADSPGEILRFKHPGDLLKMAEPDADRVQADGGHQKLKVIKAH
ncbi:MAG: metallophosphoesterase [Chthoniobacteraceae bacterium]